MNGFPNDCVAIDTNVFGHLISHSENADKHINNLLKYFMNQHTSLLVDESGEILNEYNNHLNTSEFRKKYEGSNEAYILSYWMNPDTRRKKVAVNKDTLWEAVQKVIPEAKEPVDRIFVYIAFVRGRVLISNDKHHIINRRDKLIRATCNLSPKGGDVMTSSTAIKQIEVTHND